jgi:hypothetical protein
MEDNPHKRRQKVRRTIKARSEKESSSERQILADWRRYFEDQINARPPDTPRIQQQSRDVESPLVDPGVFNTSPFTDEEITEAIKQPSLNVFTF